MKPLLLTTVICILSISPMQAFAIPITPQVQPNIVGVIDPYHDPSKQATDSFYGGVAKLVINRPDRGGSVSCTGSAIGSRWILTAAHCLADATGTLQADAAYSRFNYNFADPNPNDFWASNFFIHPLYSGALVDDHDIALIQLTESLTADIPVYDLFLDNPVGEIFDMVGYGLAGSGYSGGLYNDKRRYRASNQFEGQLGDIFIPPAEDLLGTPVSGNVCSIFNYFSVGTCGLSNEHVLLFDFDNPFDPNTDFFGFWAGLHDLASTTGIDEGNTARGDSGGPSFIDGRIAAVTSWGGTFGFPTDINGSLDGSFGEFAGNTSIAYNQDWLRSVMTTTEVPEPDLLALMGIGLMLLNMNRRYRCKVFLRNLQS